MLISHSHKFITIDIQKTGTCSLRETLVPLGIIDISGMGRSHPKFKQFIRHGTALHAKQEFKKNGWNWDDYLKYTNVRNPWKRYASFLNYKIEKAISFQSSSPEDIKQWPILRIQQGENCVNFLERWNWDNHLAMVDLIKTSQNQSSYLMNNTGDLLFSEKDIIGKVENLDKSFKQFCSTINISPIPTLVHGNKGTYQKPWRDLYNQETIDLVAEKEKWIIEKFEYNYE